MAFTFPDPSVSTVATNPETGITYQYAAGLWTPISEDAEQDEQAVLNARQDAEIADLQEGETLDRTAIFSLARQIGINEDDIDRLLDLDLTNAVSALVIAQQDIIELKSKVNSLELTSFLILE